MRTINNNTGKLSIKVPMHNLPYLEQMRKALIQILGLANYAMDEGVKPKEELAVINTLEVLKHTLELNHELCIEIHFDGPDHLAEFQRSLLDVLRLAGHMIAEGSKIEPYTIARITELISHTLIDTEDTVVNVNSLKNGKRKPIRDKELID